MTIIKPDMLNSELIEPRMEQAVNKWQKTDGTLTLKGKTFKTRVEQVLKDGARNMTYDEILLDIVAGYPADYSIDFKDNGTAKHVQTPDIKFMVGRLVQDDKVIDQ